MINFGHETEELEFKKTTGELHDAVIDMAAILNKHEKGTLYFGVWPNGDVKGFLCARRLREEDSGCRVILLDDTERYAIRGLRIHLSDFLLRPLAGSQELLLSCVMRCAKGRFVTETTNMLPAECSSSSFAR